MVIYTGALTKLNKMHQLQVMPGGKLFAIIGESPVMRGELHQLSHHEVWQSQTMFETELPRLKGQPSMATEHFVF